MDRTLQAGVAQTNITPRLGSSLQGDFRDRKADDVHDELHAKALVLGNGETRLAIVGLDLICITAHDVVQIREIVARRTGIPPHHVLIGCTHTHSGPAAMGAHGVARDDAYMAWLVPQVADAVTLAARRLQPARAGAGLGREAGLSFNRRYRMRDGTVMMNPGRGNPNIVAPAGPIDPDVFVLYVEDVNGRPLACVTNFTLHYVGADSRTEISADYFGHFASALTRLKGEGFISILLNGASGDINNVDVNDPRQESGHRQGKRVAEILAGEVLKVTGRLRPGGECSLAGAAKRVTFQRKQITPEDLDVARRILAGEEAAPVAVPGPFSWVSGMPIPKHLWANYAQECLFLSELPEQLTTEVQVLRIGDAALVALPGEIFVEIGLDIKRLSPARLTAVVGLANDCIGYCCTDRALDEGSYETWAARSALPDRGIEHILRAAATDLLAELFGAPEANRSSTHQRKGA